MPNHYPTLFASLSFLHNISKHNDNDLGEVEIIHTQLAIILASPDPEHSFHNSFNKIMYKQTKNYLTTTTSLMRFVPMCLSDLSLECVRPQMLSQISAIHNRTTQIAWQIDTLKFSIELLQSAKWEFMRKMFDFLKIIFVCFGVLYFHFSFCITQIHFFEA